MFGLGKGVAKGAAEGLVGPVAGAVSTVLTEKERTERARVEAELLREKNQLDAQSKAIERAAKANGLKGLWRPYLMFGLGVVCLLHSMQTAVMVWRGFFGEETLTADQLDLLIRWITYVMFVFGVLGAFGGVTAWRRTDEKLQGVDQSPVAAKRSTLQRMRNEPPASPVVREEMDSELPPITKRMNGIVVPPRQREPLDHSRLRDEILAEEGWRDETYLDSLGYLTGGVGHLIRPGDTGYGKPPGTKLTKAEVGRWLLDDMAAAIAAARRVVPDFDEHPQEVRISLVSMAFQLGEQGLSRFRNMLAALAERDYARAARETRNSLAYEQTTARWERHAARFETFA